MRRKNALALGYEGENVRSLSLCAHMARTLSIRAFDTHPHPVAPPSQRLPPRDRRRTSAARATNHGA